MFALINSRGDSIPYIQPQHIFDMIMEGTEEYWTGAGQFAQLEWKGDGDTRVLMIGYSPTAGFRLSYMLPDRSWIHAAKGSSLADAAKADPVEMTIEGETVQLDAREFIERDAAAAVASHYLQTGLPSAECAWIRDGALYDIAQLDLPAVTPPF